MEEQTKTGLLSTATSYIHTYIFVYLYRVTSATKVECKRPLLVKKKQQKKQKTKQNLIIHFFTIDRITNKQINMPRESMSKLENTYKI